MMLAYFARRLASTVLVMGIVAVFVFLLLHLSPGDPAAIIAGDNASGEQIAGIRRQLGLDDPLPVQFVRWLAAVLQGDLGISIFSNEPVLKLISQRVEPTLSLALTTLFVAVTLAVSFGVLAAWKVGSWIDRTLMVVSVIGFSVPVFVVGYMLIYVFSINTVLGIGVALLIGGVVITETVFNIPGVGRLVVDAISKRDYPIIQGVILIFSGVYVLVNLLVDMSYTLLDPRIRY